MILIATNNIIIIGTNNKDNQAWFTCGHNFLILETHLLNRTTLVFLIKIQFWLRFNFFSDNGLVDVYIGSKLVCSLVFKFYL